MTAYRIVTDHEELENVGQLTHPSLDSYVLNTSWIIVSGSTGPQPPTARKLKAGLGITFSDYGPGQDLVISANGVTTGSQISWMEEPTGLVDGINLTFNLSYAPLPPQALMFFVNGVLQSQGLNNDYVIVSGSVITLLHKLRSGSNLAATYPF